MPPEILAIPPLGCFNIHASLLPRWRGAAPIQRAILASDEATGTNVIRMEAGLDTGPICITYNVRTHYRDTAKILHDRLASVGAAAILNTLPSIISGSILPTPQATEGIVYAPRLSKSEAWINWHQDAFDIDRQIRAFNPWPVAQTTFQGKTLRIWNGNEPRPVAYRPAEPGTIIGVSSKSIQVTAERGQLYLTELQPVSYTHLTLPTIRLV